jgi:hypothetical protein
MLRVSLLANVEILPQARQGSYFFNRIGRLPSFATGKKRPRADLGVWGATERLIWLMLGLGQVTRVYFRTFWDLFWVSIGL